jgi:putative MATE family efflux protein
MFVVPMVGNSAMRATGDTKTPSRIMIGGAMVNLALDPILIFGFGPIPGFGLRGAAMATAVSWSLIFATAFYVLHYRKHLIEFDWGGLSALFATCRTHLRISAPATMANMFTPIALSLLTAVVATHGAAAVAAYGVGQRIEHLAILVVLALSTSLPPFISQNFGAGRMDRVAEALAKVIRFVLVWELAVYVVLALSAPWLAEVFTDDAEVARIIRIFLYILPLSYGFQGLAVLSNSSFNALHEPKRAVLLSVLRSFICYVPLAYMGSQIAGVPGLFAGAALANVVSGLIGQRWISRYVAERLPVQPA